MRMERLSSLKDERYDMIMFIFVTFIQSVYRIVIYKQGIEDNGLSWITKMSEVIKWNHNS